MKFNSRFVARFVLLIALMITLIATSSRLRADSGTCGGGTTMLPFIDVPGSNAFFCSIASAYFSGLTNGTSPTTFSPGNNVPREQMAAFVARTMDQSLKRGSERAIAKKWWTPQTADSLTVTNIGARPGPVEFDGTDLWVASPDGNVVRIRPGDGKLLDTWTGATSAAGIVAAMGRIFIAGQSIPGRLYMIDPTQPAGPVTTLTSSLGNYPRGIAFDGSRIWTANYGRFSTDSSVSIVSLNPTMVTTVSQVFSGLLGMLYDGANIWVTDPTANTMRKLNSNGSIAYSIFMGVGPPNLPIFDGTNIWVPNTTNVLTVVRVKDAVGNPLADPFILATLSGNGLNAPFSVAFDGERILVTNPSANSVSLWKAADLTPLGSFSTGAGTTPSGACSNGLNFWISLGTTNNLARF